MHKKLPHESNDLPRFVAKGKIRCNNGEITKILRDQKDNISFLLAAFYNM